MDWTTYGFEYIIYMCRWEVDLHNAFVPEFEALDEAVQDELLAHIAVLAVFGPQLGRPRADTLKRSRHRNMTELRLEAACRIQNEAV